MAESSSTDHALQHAYRAGMRAAAGMHLDAGTWERLATGDLDDATRDAAFDHVTSCAECSDTWRALLALRTDAREQGLIAPTAGAPAWRSWVMPLAIAATLMIAAAAVLINRPVPAATDIERGPSSVPAVEGQMVAADSGNGPALVWTPVGGATSYRVEIFFEDGRPLWSGEVKEPPLRWPAAAPRASGRYRWRVEALGEGGVMARSPLAPFEITR